MFMIAEERDDDGRLKVPYFVKLIKEYMHSKATYNADEFKQHVIKLGVLAAADWDVEKNGYAKWKHRIDRAAQKVFTSV